MTATPEVNTIGNHRDCVATYSGKLLSIENPDPDLICIEDIAHGLAMTARFGGQCRKFYSVAEHCCVVHDLIQNAGGTGGYAFAGLMHDAAEAYIGDLVRPIKSRQELMMFRNIEARIQAAIERRFDVLHGSAVAEVVRAADNIACRAEAHLLMEGQGELWDWGETPLVPIKMQPHSWQGAEKLFLSYFERYR